MKKLCHKYFHNLITHVPMQEKLVPGKSAHSENQERIFNTFKKITNTTSNYQTGHIIGNLFVRLQAKEKLKGHSYLDAPSKEEGEASKLFICLKDTLANTMFSFYLIRKFQGGWQAHLERIADFLYHEENIWWSQNEQGVELFDFSCSNGSVSDGPKVHHFRSSNFRKEKKYFNDQWVRCINNKVKIPVYIIKQDIEDTGLTQKLHVPYLPVRCNKDGNCDQSSNDNTTVDGVLLPADASCEETNMEMPLDDHMNNELGCNDLSEGNEQAEVVLDMTQENQTVSLA